MTWLCNVILYNLFRFEKRTQYVFTYPVSLLLRSKRVKESYKKRGVLNPEKEVLKALNDPQVGISSILSGGHMYILFFLLIFGSINFASGFLRREFNLGLEHFALMVILSITIGYFMLFRNDRYLEYFEEFEKMSESRRKRMAWLTFFVVIGIWTYGVSSFIFLNHSL